MSAAHPGAWTAGADALRPAPGDGVAAGPHGRMHAVAPAGLVEGRAVCLAPVVLLDPGSWTWPDDADEDHPLCWICLALTHSPAPDLPCDCCPP